MTTEVLSNQTDLKTQSLSLEARAMEVSCSESSLDDGTISSLQLKLAKERVNPAKSHILYSKVENSSNNKKTDQKRLPSDSNTCHHTEKLKEILLPRLYGALELAYHNDPNNVIPFKHNMTKRFKPSAAAAGENIKLPNETNNAFSSHSIESEVLSNKLEEAEKRAESAEQRVSVLLTDVDMWEKKCNQLEEKAAEFTATQEQRVSEEVATSTSQLRKENHDLETRLQEYKRIIKEMEASIQTLNNMNMQWQEYNKKKDAAMKKMQEPVEELKEKNRQLQAELDKYSDESSDIVFTEAQQRVIDGFYQRIREDADLFRDQRDATVQDAQHNISIAKQRQETAEKIAEDLQKKVEAYELEEVEYKQQIEELQAALVVAARRNNQPAPDQNLIKSLNEKVRRGEEENKRIVDDYQNVLTENSKLIQRLHESLMNKKRGATFHQTPEQRSTHQPSSIASLDNREETTSLGLQNVELDQ